MANSSIIRVAASPICKTRIVKRIGITSFYMAGSSCHALLIGVVPAYLCSATAVACLNVTAPCIRRRMLTWAPLCFGCGHTEDGYRERCTNQVFRFQVSLLGRETFTILMLLFRPLQHLRRVEINRLMAQWFRGLRGICKNLCRSQICNVRPAGFESHEFLQENNKRGTPDTGGRRDCAARQAQTLVCRCAA